MGTEDLIQPDSPPQVAENQIANWRPRRIPHLRQGAWLRDRNRRSSNARKMAQNPSLWDQVGWAGFGKESAALEASYMYSAIGPVFESVASPRLSKLTKATSERRRWPRADVRWQVQFFSLASEPLQCTTSNVSTGGFYILSERPFKPGECLNCFLAIPSHQSRRGDERLLVQCRVEVVRVESGAVENQFGTACRILDYRAWGADARA